GKGSRNTVGEKATAEVMFTTTKGERRAAKLMFLSGRVVEETPARAAGDKKQTPPGRRELLVKAALEEKSFFSRAIVNQLWAYFFGRGLVTPADQMPSANPPSVPGLLEALADDLATHGYDLDRLIAALVSSRVYSLASTHAGGDAPSESHFAQAPLRPLTPGQLALSLIVATGDGALDAATTR